MWYFFQNTSLIKSQYLNLPCKLQSVHTVPVDFGEVWRGWEGLVINVGTCGPLQTPMEAGATLFPPLCLTKITNLSRLLLGLRVDSESFSTPQYRSATSRVGR